MVKATVAWRPSVSISRRRVVTSKVPRASGATARMVPCSMPTGTVTTRLRTGVRPRRPARQAGDADVVAGWPRTSRGPAADEARVTTEDVDQPTCCAAVGIEQAGHVDRCHRGVRVRLLPASTTTISTTTTSSSSSGDRDRVRAAVRIVPAHGADPLAEPTSWSENGRSSAAHSVSAKLCRMAAVAPRR